MSQIIRWWGIRHLRWFYWERRFNYWWETVGCEMGMVPNPADLEWLDKIRRGEA